MGMIRAALAAGTLAFVAWCGAAYFDSGVAYVGGCIGFGTVKQAANSPQSPAT